MCSTSCMSVCFSLFHLPLTQAICAVLWMFVNQSVCFALILNHLFFLVLFAHRCPLLWIKDWNLNKVFSLVTYGPLHLIMVRRLHCRLFFFRVSLFTAAIVTANLQEKTKSDDGFFPLAQSELNIKSQNEQRNDKFVNKKMERKLRRVYSLEKSPMCNMSSICMRK